MDGHEQLALQIAREIEGKNPYLVNDVQLLSAILEELQKPKDSSVPILEQVLAELKDINRKQEEAAMNMTRELREIKVRIIELGR